MKEDADVENLPVGGEEAPGLAKKGVSPPSLGRLFQTVKQEQPMLWLGMLLVLAAESTTQVIPLIVAKAYDSIIDYTLESDEKMKEIDCYPGQMNQVFMNIMNNAIQAIPDEREDGELVI